MTDEKRIRELIQQLGTREWETAQAELIQVGRPAVPALIEALKDKEKTGRWRAAEALGDIGDDRAVEPLIAGLKDEEPWVRWWAANALGKIFENCKTIEALEAYEKQLDEGLARLQKKYYRPQDLVEVGFEIARLKKYIAADKNELASHRDLILEDIPKPPPKKKGRIYQSMRRATHGR